VTQTLIGAGLNDGLYKAVWIDITTGNCIESAIITKARDEVITCWAYDGSQEKLWFVKAKSSGPEVLLSYNVRLKQIGKAVKLDNLDIINLALSND